MTNIYYSIFLLTIDCICIPFCLMMTIFIGWSIKKTNVEFYTPFYVQLFLNSCCELIFFAFEYFLIRIPLFGFADDWYNSQKHLPGAIHGFAWYVYIVICIGQCNLMLNRFIVLKNPASNSSMSTFKSSLCLITFQFIFPIFMIFMPINCNLRSYYVNNNKTLVVEVEDQKISNFFLTVGSIVGIIICLFCITFGSWNIFLLKKIQNSKKYYEKRLKKEKPLLLSVCLQTVNFIVLTTAEILQYFAGKFNLDRLYAFTIYMYPLSEDMLCLLHPIILYITCHSLRKKFLNFWFRGLYKKIRGKKIAPLSDIKPMYH
uniref:Serpentine Receptor, class T n=1 Tax=Strongyloides papillosus TaxID=174720 RepID=A0A0N5CBC2_STREA